MLFPLLAGKKSGKVDLNLLSKQWLQERFPEGVGEDNPLLDPAVCMEMISFFHYAHDLWWSYGGYMENRRNLWRKSYLEKSDTFIHLGVDFNVAPGEIVAASRTLEILEIDSDYSSGGWGNRVVAEIRGEPIILIYAHLASRMRFSKGETIKAGDKFARVGTSDENGNWFPHLHIQAIEAGYYHSLTPDQFLDLDGYGRETEDRFSLEQHFPDPLSFVDL